LTRHADARCASRNKRAGAWQNPGQGRCKANSRSCLRSGHQIRTSRESRLIRWDLEQTLIVPGRVVAVLNHVGLALPAEARDGDLHIRIDFAKQVCLGQICTAKDLDQDKEAPTKRHRDENNGQPDDDTQSPNESPMLRIIAWEAAVHELVQLCCSQCRSFNPVSAKGRLHLVKRPQLAQLLLWIRSYCCIE
jgi:hypothetical protein